jgi:hypothetical protein
MITVYYIVLQCDNTQHSMGPHDVVIAITIAIAIAITISIAIPLQSRRRRRRCCEDKPAGGGGARGGSTGGRAGDKAGSEARYGCVARVRGVRSCRFTLSSVVSPPVVNGRVRVEVIAMEVAMETVAIESVRRLFYCNESESARAHIPTTRIYRSYRGLTRP